MNAIVTPISQAEQRDAIERRMKTVIQEMIERQPMTTARFALSHVSAEREVIHVFTPQKAGAKAKMPSDQADDAAREFYAVAKDHFDSFNGTGQRYRLLPEDKDGEASGKPYFFGLGQAEPVRKREAENEPVGGGLDAKILKILLDQNKMLMENNQKLIELHSEQAPQVINNLALQNRELASECMRLFRTQIKARQLLEDSQSQEAQRTLMIEAEQRKVRLQEEAARKLWGTIWPAIRPAILSRLRRALGDASATVEDVKALEAKAENAPESEKQAELVKVGEAQGKFRELLKVLGRDKILLALPAEKHDLINDLTGVGATVLTIASLRFKAQVLWSAVSDNAQEALGALSDRPELADWVMSFTEGGD